MRCPIVIRCFQLAISRSRSPVHVGNHATALLQLTTDEIASLIGAAVLTHKRNMARAQRSAIISIRMPVHLSNSTLHVQVICLFALHRITVLCLSTLNRSTRSSFKPQTKGHGSLSRISEKYSCKMSQFNIYIYQYEPDTIL